MAFTLLEKELASTSPERLSATRLKVTHAIVQAQRANAAAIQLAPQTFATGKGYELPKPVADTKLGEIVIRPSLGAESVDLYDWFALGSANDGLTIIYETY